MAFVLRKKKQGYSVSGSATPKPTMGERLTTQVEKGQIIYGKEPKKHRVKTMRYK